ncbi:MAG: hypothetical protein V4538_15100 [Bacteroidota bacterium]
MKENIIKWCDNLQRILSLKESHEVKFVSQYKDSCYYLPQIQIGSTTPKSYVAWFCEIWVDGVCIFRESRIPENQTDEEMENMVIEILMQSVFNYGVMGAKDILEKIK